jgi:hypothetical protein
VVPISLFICFKSRAWPHVSTTLAVWCYAHSGFFSATKPLQAVNRCARLANPAMICRCCNRSAEHAGIDWATCAEEDEELVILEVVDALCDELIVDALCSLTRP